jgi:hypothetical protein
LKKVLIISTAFYPEQSPRSFRATELAKELCLQGHHVTVATTPKDGHDNFQKLFNIKIVYICKDKIEELAIKGGRLESIIRRLIRRSLDYFFNFPEIKLKFWVKRFLNKSNDRYDAIISIAVPHSIHWGVAAVNSKKRRSIAKIWLADCGDPFMYAGHDTFKRLFYFHFFENKFLKKADYTVVPFEEMKALFNAKFKGKLKVIPQGFKFTNINLPEYVKHTIPTFVYSGTIMPHSRDPYQLIDYLESVCIKYKFVIYTNNTGALEKYQHLFEERLFIKKYIQRELLIIELAKADFLINVNTISVDGKINAIPTKLIDYRISKRPILSYEQGCLPLESLKEFLSGNYTNQFIDENFERYKIEHVVQEFLNLIK